MDESMAARVEAEGRRRAAAQITNQKGETQTMTMHAEAVTDLLKTNERNEWEIGRHLYEARQLAEDKEACEREGIEGANANQRFNRWLVVSDFRNSLKPTQRTCLMNAHEHFGYRKEQVEHLGKSVLYELAAPKCDAVREELVEQWSDPDTVVKVKDVKAALPTPVEAPARAKSRIANIDDAVRYIVNHAAELSPDMAKTLAKAMSDIAAQFEKEAA
jgi:hypothetical protein